jgi:CBS domain-containing membrane protein
VTVTPETRLGTVAELFRRHDFKSLPVVADGRRLRGMITQNDLIQHARRDAMGRGGGFAAAVRRMADATGLSPMRAGDVMRTEIAVVSPGDGIGGLIGLMADRGAQAVPVVDDDRVVGVVTRSDLIALLARRSLVAGPQ